MQGAGWRMSFAVNFVALVLGCTWLAVMMTGGHPICVDYSFPDTARDLSFCSEYAPGGLLDTGSSCCITSGPNANNRENQVASALDAKVNLGSLSEPCRTYIKRWYCGLCAMHCLYTEGIGVDRQWSVNITTRADPLSGHLLKCEGGVECTRSLALLCPGFCSDVWQACNASIANNGQPLLAPYTTEQAFCEANSAENLYYCLPFNSSTFAVPPPVSYQLEKAFEVSFTRPTCFRDSPDNSGKAYVCEKDGRIVVFDNTPSASTKSTFLDLTATIADAADENSEVGLLGLAFDPDYANNKRFYVSWMRDSPLRVIISRFIAINATSADRASEVLVLEVTKPFSNHNGGKITFGPDGMLYIGIGDGGSGGDPQNNGQSKNTLLGKILRVKVNGTLPMEIPVDNPFVGSGRGEIWAYGLRNPWQFDFDLLTGELYCADVGQDRIEEVDIIEKGGNYGWKVFEGTECFDGSASCQTTSPYTFPIFEYPHPELRGDISSASGIYGNSVSGGQVYRGTNVSTLYGRYIFTDYSTSQLVSLIKCDTTWYAIPIGSLSASVVEKDRYGEVYLLNYDGNGGPTFIWRFSPQPYTDPVAFTQVTCDALRAGSEGGSDGGIPSAATSVRRRNAVWWWPAALDPVTAIRD